jgi:hypothetical protein
MRLIVEAENPSMTPKFKAWFGNSKVVDADGRPLIVYHGTNRSFDQFDSTKSKSRTTDAPKWASFFTDSPELAGSYAKRAGRKGSANVVPVYLSLQNPLEVPGRNYAALTTPLAGHYYSTRYGQYITVRPGDEIHIDALCMMARDAGYDGLIARNVPDPAQRRDWKINQSTYVSFNARQIKSAIGNRGSFDHSDSIIETV